jgi:hypothetical protein
MIMRGGAGRLAVLIARPPPGFGRHHAAFLAKNNKKKGNAGCPSLDPAHLSNDARNSVNSFPYWTKTNPGHQRRNRAQESCTRATRTCRVLHGPTIPDPAGHMMSQFPHTRKLHSFSLMCETWMNDFGPDTAFFCAESKARSEDSHGRALLGLTRPLTELVLSAPVRSDL